MEPLVLSDKSVYPHDDLIFSIIGNNSVYWKKLLDAIREKFPASEEVWKYYDDGKNWLFRVILKKKTLFWIGVLEDTFRITFYFGDKAEQAIEKSSLPEDIKTAFKNGKHYGKIRAITIKVKSQEDVDHALVVAGIRSAMK
jgi:ABC-type uncharacterized transport system YnjBCD substrate-binding protein